MSLLKLRWQVGGLRVHVHAAFRADVPSLQSELLLSILIFISPKADFPCGYLH